MKRFNILILICCIILSVLPVSAENASLSAAPGTLKIQNVDDFLLFTENCRLDQFSENLVVSLETDLDLAGHDFSGIPVFCGIFSGNGHTISGLSLTHNGSSVGLFRYLTASAAVTDLHVSGTVAPQGSASKIGGIAGENAGSITNCSFSGTIEGTEYAGTIAGTNSGMIQNCTANGNISGNHFIGGIAGSNPGNIQNCINRAQINTTHQQNDVDITEITIDSITGTESPGSVTDVGGISGITSGSVIGCENFGNVGYPRIGYNIGGISGSLTGYIADCKNHGAISGRKDIGGITGQLEPAVAITYSTDTLQILQGQVNDLSALVDIAASNTFNTISSIQNQITLIQGKLQSASDALGTLLPEEGTFPKPEALGDAIVILEDTVSSVTNSLNIIYKNLDNAESTLSRDIQNISDSVATIQQTLNNSSENLGGSVTDHSDGDTEGDLTAKIQNCQNSGTISADRNGGGIAGTLAFENDLDPETDIEILGDTTLNFSGAYRAVIIQCSNTASIAVKKQYAGGIAGFVSIGLIKSCTNHANLFCEAASFVGGIAGRSDGYIRNCCAKAQVAAKESAGGIAGQGKTVSDCASLASVTAKEKSGAILGYSQDISLLNGNHYMEISQDPGAVDGISYANAAQSLSTEAFLSLPELPAFFQNYTVTFYQADGTAFPISVKTDQVISQEQIPALPDIDGCKGSWLGLESIRYFDSDVICSYEERSKVISSTEIRENGLPILLAEGSFLPGTALSITKQTQSLASDAIEGWNYACAGASTLRFLPPDGHSATEVIIMEQASDGSWKQIPHTVCDSYVVFSPSDTEGVFCVVSAPHTPWGLYIGISAAFLMITAIVCLIILRRRKASRGASDRTDA